MAVDPPYRIKNMVPGMIMLWHGSVATIPSGWHLCDGTVGTPDLRDRWVPCAGGAYAPNYRFGFSTHVHDFIGDGHAHGLPSGTYIEDIYPDGDYDHSTDANPARGTTDSADHRPKSEALCYIMKL